MLFFFGQAMAPRLGNIDLLLSSQESISLALHMHDLAWLEHSLSLHTQHWQCPIYRTHQPGYLLLLHGSVCMNNRTVPNVLLQCIFYSILSDSMYNIYGNSAKSSNQYIVSESTGIVLVYQLCLSSHQSFNFYQNCQSNYFIYVITWKTCGIQYVGKKRKKGIQYVGRTSSNIPKTLWITL